MLLGAMSGVHTAPLVPASRYFASESRSVNFAFPLLL